MEDAKTMHRDDQSPNRRLDKRESKVPDFNENPVSRWILIRGNRWTVSVVALALVGMGLVVLGIVWTDELLTMFTETQVIRTVLITLLSGIILLVSIAVSINSIVLSQEITALGDQEERIEETFAFRDSVQTYTQADVSPARPAAFLNVIFEAMRSNAQTLANDIASDQSGLSKQVRELRDDIVDQIEAVENRLDERGSSTSEVLFAGIRYDYSDQVRALRRIRMEHDDVLTDEQDQRIDELLTGLKYFTVGREYFKTLYFKRELANLSRGLLAVAFPAVVLLSYAIVSIESGLVPDVTAFGLPAIVLFVVVTYVIGLAPYTLFSAYVFRTATISLRTLAAGPFILEEGRRERIDRKIDTDRR